MYNITKGTVAPMTATFMRDGEIFPVDSCTELCVFVQNVFKTYIAETFSIDHETGNVLLFDIPDTLPCGVYGIGVRGKLNGQGWRSFVSSVVKITHATEAEGDGEMVTGDSYDVVMEVQLFSANAELMILRHNADALAHAGLRAEIAALAEYVRGIEGADLRDVLRTSDIIQEGNAISDNMSEEESRKVPDVGRLVSYVLSKLPTVPANVSAFINDVGYLREHQSLKTLNGASLVGSGNIEVNVGYDIVLTQNNNVTLEAGKYYKFGEVESLTLNFGPWFSDGKLNEYMFEFESGDTPTRLSLPADIEVDVRFQILSNSRYIGKVVDGLLSISGAEAYYLNDEATLTSLFNHTIRRINIPSGVTSIIADLFYGASQLSDVTIPGTVTSIGTRAFASCVSLTGIQLPSSVKSIGEDGFANCTSLISINLGEITSLGTRAFQNCRSLQSVDVSKATTWGNNVFQGCSNLQSVTLAPTLSAIVAYAFTNTSLQSIELPESITSIGANAFQGTPLQSITLPANVRTLGNTAFDSCRDLVSINIPSGVTAIPANFLCNCVSLQSIDIPNSVTTINQAAFQGCISLTEVTLPNSVTNLVTYAFRLCRFTKITLHDSITTIGTNNVFAENPYLETVKIIGTTRVIPYMSGLNGTCQIYVDDTMVNSYKTSSAWRNYAARIHSINELVE